MDRAFEVMLAEIHRRFRISAMVHSASRDLVEHHLVAHAAPS